MNSRTVSLIFSVLKVSTNSFFKAAALSLLLLLSLASIAQSWGYVGTAGFSAGVEMFNTLRISNADVPYVCFQDNSASSKPTVMKFTGGAWSLVGTAGFSSGVAAYPHMALDASGTPYVVFQDGTVANKATVMKYNGTAWVIVGTAGFSTGAIGSPAIAIDPSGNPWVVFQDNYLNQNTTVMKFNGTTWSAVGTSGLSFGSVSGTSYQNIAFAPSGTPYIAFSDGYSSAVNKATVLKYDGADWVTVGAANFTSANASFITMAIDPSGTPYVAFVDGATGTTTHATSVMKFNGTNWVLVGSAGFTPTGSSYPSIAIDPGGTPYLGFADNSMGSRASVMRFDGSSWSVIGSPGFTAGQAGTTRLAINSSSTPLIFYTDYFFSIRASVMTLINPVSAIHGDTVVCVGSTLSLTDSTGAGIWRSSDSALASVDAGGFVTGHASGSVVISYTYISTTRTANITILPVPTLSSTLMPPAVACGDTFHYLPASGIAGAGFQWSRAVTTGITNAAATGIGPINEALVNNTALPITVNYVFIVSNSVCADTQTVSVVVNPCSNVLVGNVQEAPDPISISPNPASGALNVFIDGSINEMGRVDICSINGGLVRSVFINGGNNHIQISDLPAGLYYCKIVFEGMSQIKKVIVN